MSTDCSPLKQKVIVVIGNGLVGLSFIEEMVKLDTDHIYHIEVFSNESGGKNRKIYIFHYVCFEYRNRS